MITCGWCNTHYASWRSRCDACGGPMPPMPGNELGAAPPPAPRTLPHGFAIRTRWSRNIAVLAGSGFLAIGAIIFAGMVSAKTWAAMFPLFFMAGGFFMFRIGWREASRTLRAFRRGQAVAGAVVSVSLDRTQSVNQQHPWKLVYQFTAEDGHRYEGSVTSFDSTLASRAVGQPLWVLYRPHDPGQNTLYPPLR